MGVRGLSSKEDQSTKPPAFSAVFRGSPVGETKSPMPSVVKLKEGILPPIASDSGVTVLAMRM